MSDEQNLILQMTDLVTGRRCPMRIDPQDWTLLLSGLLDKYLKDCPVQALVKDNALTPESAEVLQDLQDLVYVPSDGGRLRGMYAGVEFKQHDRTLGLDEVLEIETARVGGARVDLIDIAIDRTSAGYDRNWVGFHRRRWDRHAELYSSFVGETLARDYSGEEAERIVLLETTDHKVKLLRSLGRRIWESEFENYSRFVGRKLPFKTGDETVHSIIDGAGGICTEKVQALKFLTDHFGLQSEYILAGVDTKSPVPEDRLRELLTTFDFRFAKRYMRYWQHLALLYTIDGATVLVDDTNGNIPFLFLKGEEHRSLLDSDGKVPVAVRMVMEDEDFYYHSVSQDIPENLLFAMEGWIQHVDLVQVFENELGLLLTPDFYVTPIVFRHPRGYERERRRYLEACDRAGMECSVNSAWTLDSPLGRRFAERHPRASEKILLARDHLLERYDDWEGPGHDAGLVVVALQRSEGDPRDAR